MSEMDSSLFVPSWTYETTLDGLRSYRDRLKEALSSSDDSAAASAFALYKDQLEKCGQAVEYIIACVEMLSRGVTDEEDIRNLIERINIVVDDLKTRRKSMKEIGGVPAEEFPSEHTVLARTKQLTKRIEKALREALEEKAKESAEKQNAGAPVIDAENDDEAGYSAPAANWNGDDDVFNDGSMPPGDYEYSLPDYAEESVDDVLYDVPDLPDFIQEKAREEAAFPAQEMGGMSMPDMAESVQRPTAQYIPMPVPAPMPAMPSAPQPIEKKERVKVKVEKFNKVDFSVLTSESMKPGKSSLIDVFMYTKGQRRIVDKALKNAAEKKVEAVRSGSRVSVRQGSQVTVVLSSDDAAVENCAETMLWSGDALDFTFRVTVPEDFKKKQADFACEILFDGIHISRLYFSVKLNTAKAVPVRFVRKDSKKAFVSYSHKDKQRVVDQLVAIQSVAPKMRFWMDNQSMSAGQLWRREIKSAIDGADVFLLFWSSSAKASEEVEKEWRYALELENGRKRRRSGAGFISPVPLDSPSDCPPPAELSRLHFGDPSFDISVDDIDRVKFYQNGKKPKNIRFLGK